MGEVLRREMVDSGDQEMDAEGALLRPTKTAEMSRKDNPTMARGIATFLLALVTLTNVPIAVFTYETWESIRRDQTIRTGGMPVKLETGLDLAAIARMDALPAMEHAGKSLPKTEPVTKALTTNLKQPTSLKLGPAGAPSPMIAGKVPEPAVMQVDMGRN